MDDYFQSVASINILPMSSHPSQIKENQFNTLKFSYLRCFIVLLFIVVWSIFMPIVFFLSLLIPFFDSQKLPRVFHKGVCILLGLEVEFIGQPVDTKPVLFVSNHVSYLDIFALGQKVPGFFVAKSEVASWPVLSKLAKLQNTVFIERKNGRAKQQIQLLRSYFESRENLILFPEGTSTNGAEVLPLKSSLFAATESETVDVTIQPISIAYTQYQGQGMNQVQRDNFAWYADMPFGSHFLNVAGLGKVNIVIVFNDSISISECDSRKECAQRSEDAMRQSFTESFQASGSVE